MKYAFYAAYRVTKIGYANFPTGKTWGDVEDWYVKWDTLHVKFKESTEWQEFELNSDSWDTDWKRPDSCSVHPTDEEGGVDFNEELAEQ